MKILMINVVCGIKSTGRICTDLAEILVAQGHNVKIAYGREKVPEKYQKYAVKIGVDLDVNVHAIKARMFDSMGFESTYVTKKFITWVKEYNPDVIHLHNLHGYYINVEILFKYLRTCGKKIIWTLHDCWAFTGHCTHFDYIGCEEWKKGCKKCLQKREYPKCYGHGFSERNFKRKKELFSNIPNMIIVTPSIWLAKLVQQSFLKCYQIKTIHNGIDISIFKKLQTSNRSQNELGKKKVILGVASQWNEKKGFQYMLELSKRLSEQVVIVGVSEKQKKTLPDDIIGICHTNKVEELVQWYNLADVFVNPTLEDNYPTTNLEAIACGTPVISFDSGGSAESASLYGAVVPRGNCQELESAVRDILNDLPKYPCVDLSKEKMLKEYINLY